VNPLAAQRAAAGLSSGLDVRRVASEACLPQLLAAAEVITHSFRNGGKLLICGNGGSAADSQHMAAELTSRLTMDYERPGLPALALTTDTSFLTAYSNDFSYEGVFARQVEALGRPGDVLLGISTSGQSRNVLLAVRQAQSTGLATLALSGGSGELNECCDVSISVPSQITRFVQETHLAFIHTICDLVERELYGYEDLS
jgi:D-sedoheptulose 7-phosphate isomerase